MVVSLLVSFNAVAQEPKKTIIDFGKGGKKTMKEDTDNSDVPALDKQNAIYIDLLSAPSGFVTLGYERAITNQISAEVTGGITFTSITETITSSVTTLFAPTAYADNAAYWTDKGYTVVTNGPTRSQKLGAYASASAKFFLEDEVFDGFFLAPRLQYINFNYQTTKPFTGILSSGSAPYGTPNTTQVVTTSKNYIDIIPTIGWNSSGSRIVWSYELGVGARFVNINDYDSGYKGNANGSYIYETRNYNQTYVVPMLSSILRMGVMF
jgi:hypothetical protein